MDASFSELYLCMQCDLFKHSRYLHALAHGAFEDGRFSCVMDLPSEPFSFRQVTSQGFDQLADDFFKGMDLIIEENHRSWWLHQFVALRDMFRYRLLRHAS